MGNPNLNGSTFFHISHILPNVQAGDIQTDGSNIDANSQWIFEDVRGANLFEIFWNVKAGGGDVTLQFKLFKEVVKGDIPNFYRQGDTIHWVEMATLISPVTVLNGTTRLFRSQAIEVGPGRIAVLLWGCVFATDLIIAGRRYSGLAIGV